MFVLIKHNFFILSATVQVYRLCSFLGSSSMKYFGDKWPHLVEYLWPEVSPSSSCDSVYKVCMSSWGKLLTIPLVLSYLLVIHRVYTRWRFLGDHSWAAPIILYICTWVFSLWNFHLPTKHWLPMLYIPQRCHCRHKPKHANILVLSVFWFQSTYGQWKVERIWFMLCHGSCIVFESVFELSSMKVQAYMLCFPWIVFVYLLSFLHFSAMHFAF